MLNPFAQRRCPLPLAIALAFGVGNSEAATITVTDAGDSGDSGTCTLRQAMVSMNSQSLQGACAKIGNFADSDTIVFDTAAVPSNSTITLAMGELTVNFRTASLTIEGTGQTIDGGGASRVMYLHGTDVTLSRLTLTNGSATPAGGIYSKQTSLTLDRVTVSNNTGTAHAGGIYSTGGGALHLEQTTVTGNVLEVNDGPTLNGAGIRVSTAELRLNQSTVSANTLHVTHTSGNANYGAGGIMVSGASDTVVIVDSTIAGNAVNASDGGDLGYFGGAIYASGSLPLLITNSTIFGNSVACGYRCAGGIYVNEVDATLANSTVSGNVNTAAGPDHWGGVFVWRSTLTSINSILSGNSAGGSPSDLSLSANYSQASAGSSLLGSALASSNFGPNNLYGDDPMLTALANHGGPTKTVALTANSPAVNAGDPAFALNPETGNPLLFDQRGPGYQRILPDGSVDIGAWQHQGTDRVFADPFESGP